MLTMQPLPQFPVHLSFPSSLFYIGAIPSLPDAVFGSGTAILDGSGTTTLFCLLLLHTGFSRPSTTRTSRIPTMTRTTRLRPIHWIHRLPFIQTDFLSTAQLGGCHNFGHSHPSACPPRASFAPNSSVHWLLTSRFSAFFSALFPALFSALMVYRQLGRLQASSFLQVLQPIPWFSFFFLFFFFPTGSPFAVFGFRFRQHGWLSFF